MEDDLGKEKKPLVWPTLNLEVDEDKHIEHIHLKLDESSIEQLLFEIELECKDLLLTSEKVDKVLQNQF
jgi:hypothetical protein